jgi:hypothetical protein
MSTHVHGLTVTMLADAFRTARTVDHAVTLVDDATHTVVVIDQRGRVTPRADQGRPAVPSPPETTSDDVKGHGSARTS